MRAIYTAIRNFLATQTIPVYVPREIDCCTIADSPVDLLDLSPEKHIGMSAKHWTFDVMAVTESIEDGKRAIATATPRKPSEAYCETFPLSHFIKKVERGKSGRRKTLPDGTLPLITTSERRNGISDFVDADKVGEIYSAGHITISANGGSCRAFYHDYRFAANADVFVVSLKDEFDKRDFGLFLCAAINNESWRFNYYRKFSTQQLHDLRINMPIDVNGDLDFVKIANSVEESMLWQTL